MYRQDIRLKAASLVYILRRSAIMEPNPMTARLRQLVSTTAFDRFIMVVILLNAVTLGLETSPSIMAQWGSTLHALDALFLWIFTIELAMRLLAFGRDFPRDPWRIFDFVIVAIAWMPAGAAFSVLRALRILRVLRLLGMVPSLRRVIGGLLAAIPGMGSIMGLLALVFYVFSVVATKLFSATFPEWFGNLGASAYTLFQVMTLESWSMGIVRPVMEVHPYAWAFFIPFIVATTFTVLNLFIGIIVSAMQTEHEEAASEERQSLHADQETMLGQIRILTEEVRAMREELASSQARTTTVEP